jgi:adenine-specific DNA methylase
VVACRAVLIATLLSDPDDPDERREILQRLRETVGEKVKIRRLPDGPIEDTMEEETKGRILHRGRESESHLDWFRQRIVVRAPKALEPFAGAGSASVCHPGTLSPPSQATAEAKQTS